MNQTNKFEIYLEALLEHLPDTEKKLGIVGSLFQKAAAYAVGEYTLEHTDETNSSLSSIFSNLLYAQQSLDPPSVYHFSPQSFRLDKSAFPQAVGDGQYRTTEIWADFHKEYAQLSAYESPNIRAKAETLLHLLHRYTVHLPAPIGRIKTISHYDFAKSFAGISVCLYEYLVSRNSFSAPIFIDHSKEQPFLLIGGDLSGVQDFLYDIIGKDALKNLKGRSFYLQMLIQSILEKLLHTLDLFQGNVIYSSGGSFLIIAPNIANNIEKIKALEKAFTKQLFETHQTQLSLALDIVTLSVADIVDGGLKDKMKLLFDKQTLKKHQKFSTLLDSSTRAEFFDPIQVNEGGGFPIDAISGEEIPDSHFINQVVYKLPDDGQPTHFPGNLQEFYKIENLKIVSKATYQQIRLGKILKDVTYWVIAKQSIKLKNSIDEFNPCELGTYHYLLKKEEDLNALKLDATAKIYAINKSESILLEEGLKQQTTMGFVLYGGNKFPLLEGTNEPMTLSEMAGSEEPDRKETYKEKYPIDKEDTGLKRLGVLRMDVDNLGYLIQNGFGRQYSLVQYSCLSRNLDFFFKGYLNTIWENNLAAFHKHSQIIYAGGDDLFIVGRWDKMIQLATVIKEEFTAFVAPNRQITISGGLSIVGHKFPLMKAADLAGKQEKLAKRHQYIKPNLPELILTKDSFTLFGTPLHWSEQAIIDEVAKDWSNEWLIVEKLKNQLLGFLNPQPKAGSKKTPKGISKGFLQKIALLYELSEVQRQKKKNQKWRWIIAYDFARTKKDLDNKKLYKESAFLKEIEKGVITDSYLGTKLKSNHSFFRLLYLAARWAELAHKMNKSKEQNHQNL